MRLNGGVCSYTERNQALWIVHKTKHSNEMSKIQQLNRHISHVSIVELFLRLKPETLSTLCGRRD